MGLGLCFYVEGEGRKARYIPMSPAQTFGRFGWALVFNLPPGALITVPDNDNAILPG